MQIRRLTRADVDAAAELTARVFGRGEQVQSYFELARAASLHCPFMPPELCWGVFAETGELLAKWQLVDLSVRVLGVPLRTAGAFAIAAEPGLRDADVVRSLVAAGKREVNELGFDLLLGLAERGSLYQRVGGRPICAESVWEIDALHVPAPQRRLAQVSGADELHCLVDVYARANAARSGTLVRSAELLAFLPRRAPVVLAAEGGYVALRETSDGVEVRELAGEDPRFFELVLRELAERARERGLRRVFGSLPVDHPLVHASAKHGARVSVDYPRHSGCMAGVIDAQRLLDKLSPAFTARLASSRVAAETVELEVRVPDQRASVVLGGPRRDASPLRVTLALSDVGALAQLVFGYLPARAVLAAEDAARLDARQLELLELLFVQPAPFVWYPDRF